MDKGFEQRFLKRRYTNSQQAYKKMLIITNLWDNAKQTTISYHLTSISMEIIF